MRSKFLICYPGNVVKSLTGALVFFLLLCSLLPAAAIADNRKQKVQYLEDTVNLLRLQIENLQTRINEIQRQHALEISQLNIRIEQLERQNIHIQPPPPPKQNEIISEVDLKCIKGHFDKLPYQPSLEIILDWLSSCRTAPLSQQGCHISSSRYNSECFDKAVQFLPYQPNDEILKQFSESCKTTHMLCTY